MFKMLSTSEKGRREEQKTVQLIEFVIFKL